MNNCIFCKIINGDFNTEFIYEDDDFVAFDDINPQAPTHMLIVPKAHFESLSKSKDVNDISISKLLHIAKRICALQNIDFMYFSYIYVMC